MDLTVLYEDDHLLVVNKDPGLLSVPGRGPEKADCVVARAAGLYSWIREVHRLDQATSGILVLAKNRETHRSMSLLFQERKIEKSYEALVGRRPEDPRLPGLQFLTESGDSGTIRLRQHLDVTNRPRQVVSESLEGREALTEWRVLQQEGDVFRLNLTPCTGRTHQLRLAMAACGAAILGDRLYASEPGDADAPRLMLHATSLQFVHPVTGRELQIGSAPGF